MYQQRLVHLLHIKLFHCFDGIIPARRLLSLNNMGTIDGQMGSHQWAAAELAVDRQRKMCRLIIN
jgi:hypothetical protein